MDKIAAYELLLEDHPLWVKEAASAPGAQIFKFMDTGRKVGRNRVRGGRMMITAREPVSLESPIPAMTSRRWSTRMRQGQMADRAGSARESAHVFMQHGFTPPRPLTQKQRALKARLKAKNADRVILED